VLLLEDLSGARAGDVLAGCSPSEASLVLDAVALFHAGWWGCPLHAVFPWLPRWGGDHRARQERYARQVGPFLQRYGDRLPRAVRAAVERLSGRYAAVLAALDQAPATVIHADLHLDNVLFAPPGTQPPAVVLDWQGVAAGPAAVDVAFFLVGSLAPDQRRATEDDLLRHYHADLASHGLDGYPVERLHHDYRLALLWHLARTVGWLAGADPNRLVGRERALVAAAIGDGRLIAALLDHDAARLVEAI
jgi:aminoglycoside phosphotransferase (APT) family kinase protein